MSPNLKKIKNTHSLSLTKNTFSLSGRPSTPLFFTTAGDPSPGDSSFGESLTQTMFSLSLHFPTPSFIASSMFSKL